MKDDRALSVGQIIVGPFFNEQMRIETVSCDGSGRWTLGLVGKDSERFRRVTLTENELASITIIQQGFT